MTQYISLFEENMRSNPLPQLFTRKNNVQSITSTPIISICACSGCLMDLKNRKGRGIQRIKNEKHITVAMAQVMRLTV